MESLNSPYLDAIQRIEGSTQGEKYRTLNKIAANVVAKVQTAHTDPLAEIKSSSAVPDPLVPLVYAEVSKKLQDPEGIIASLKSEDPLVFERALGAKWFFDGSNPDITNTDYYGTHIFPHLSLNNRILLVKKLAVYLSSSPGDGTSIAEDFYIGLTAKYGKTLAQPLLIACRESFIRKLIIEDRKIALSSRLIETIYKQYPNTVIDYLKLSKSSDDESRNFARIDIHDYSTFLPRLMKNNFTSFIEILEMHNDSLWIRLSRTQCDLFMKLGIDAFLRNPKVFLPLVDLKVTAKLTDNQFKLMFTNLFPEKIDSFYFSDIYGYLEYYQNDKMKLLLSTFEEIYHCSLLEDEKRLTPQVLKVLPLDERVKQAKKKLEKDDDWHLGCTWEFERSWRCYLSIGESIPLIKQEISKSSAVNDRRDLLQLMMLTCSINNDRVALLEALKYIILRHKNEQGWMLLEVLGGLMRNFEVQHLGLEHWEIINDLIQLLHVKNELLSRYTESRDILVGAIHFSLINNLPIGDQIDLYIEVNSKQSSRWNMLEDHPEYEKRCLEAILATIPEKYPLEDEMWDSWQSIVFTLVQSLYEFNARNSRTRESKIDKFSLENYPWLLGYVKRIVNSKEDMDYSFKQQLRDLLKEGERDLYDAYVEDKPEEPLFSFGTTELLVLLKKHPEKIDEDWEKYLASLQHCVNVKLCMRFLKSCRWHQELPIKFARKSLSTFASDQPSRSLEILALLYEGAAFERLITPHIPKTATVDAKTAEAKSEYSRIFGICTAFNRVTPPVSLDLVLDFCVGDYVHTTVNCLANVDRRVSVDKVIPFTRKLMDKGVSIKKHGIRLFIRVASIDEVGIMLTNLLRNEKHRSIRAVVFDSILKLFADGPNQETWAIVREAIEDLRPDDDAISSMADVGEIPDEFIVDYVRLYLNAIRRLEHMEDGLGRKQALAKFSRVMNSVIHVSHVFPEQFHEFILREYFSDLSKPDYAFSPVMRSYVVRGYLKNAGGKLEGRLECLSRLLREIIEKYWDLQCDEEPGLLLGNHLVRCLTEEVMQTPLDHTIMKPIAQSLFKTFFSELRPAYAPISYAYLTYASIFDGTLSSGEFAQKVGDVLPTVIAALSGECLSIMASVLKKFMGLKISQGEWGYTKLDVVEGLLDLNDDNSGILAAMLLYYRLDTPVGPQFWRIVERLKRYQHPAVVANVYRCVNDYKAEWDEL